MRRPAPRWRRSGGDSGGTDSEARPADKRGRRAAPRACAASSEEALVDAYGEDEQHGAFLAMLEDHAACPFRALVVGEEADVQGFDWAGAPREIVALCRHKGRTYRVNATALQWSGRRSTGAEWFDAYRAWLNGVG